MKPFLSLIILFISINLFSQELEFGKVSKEELEEKFYSKDSTANAVYLLKEQRTFYTFKDNSGFSIVTRVRERIKFYNKEGIEHAVKKIFLHKGRGDYERINSLKGYTFNLENETIKKDKLKSKNIFTEQLSENTRMKKVVFPNVKEGTIIDLKYEITSPYTNNINEINFQFNIPVKKYKTSIAVPEYFVFKEDFKGFYHITPTVEMKNGSLIISQKRRSGRGLRQPVKTNFSERKINFKVNKATFVDTDIPALKDDEPFVINANNYRGGVKYELSYFKPPYDIPQFFTTSWKDVSKRVYLFNGFGTELSKTRYFKKDLKALIADNDDDFKKIAAIFQFVKSKVKWNGNYGKFTEKGVVAAYKEGVGNIADINLMLTSMLREAGLNANPVLISSRDNGIPFYPTIDGFNYVIAHIAFKNGQYMILDASEPYSIPNLLPVRALNWKGRLVTKKGGSFWVNTSPAHHAIESHKLSFNINEDRSVEGVLKSNFSYLRGMTYRIENSDTTNETLISKLENDYNIEIEELKITNKLALTKPVGQNIKFSSEDLIEEIGGKIYVKPLLFKAITSNPFKRETRDFPVDFSAKWKDKFLVSIAIPKGYKVESMPKTIGMALPDKLGSFKYVVRQKEDVVIVNSILQINDSSISQTDYKALKEFYEKIVMKHSEKIIFSKK